MAPLRLSPLPRRYALRLGQAPDPQVLGTRLRFVLEERLVPQVLAKHPGVALPHELAVDVPDAEVDVADTPTVAVRVNLKEPHDLAEDLR